MNRRQRRRLQALIALCLFCVVIGTLLGMRHTGEVLHTQQTQALGTSILIGAQGSESRPALAAAEREIERLDALFAYDGDGDIAKLNAEGSITADADTVALLERAKEISAETAGLYSCTAAPLLDAWRLAASADRVPTDAELTPLLDKVDDSKIKISGDRITIPDGVRVNVDSIARGYIADRVRKIFSDYNLERGFVNLDIDKARFANGDAGLLEGGGIACYSTSPRDSAWTISIPNPADPERVIANYQTLSDAVFNAGLYQQTVQSGGRSYRLIIDPRSGEPADTSLASVSVSSKDGPLAAALAEALYVMGKDEAIDFWDDHRIDFDAIFIDDTGSVTPTGKDITITSGIYKDEGASFTLIDDPGGNSPLEESDERATRII